MSDALIGQILQGTYRIERVIGSGGMGSVYEAGHQRLNKRFAVKVLSPEVAGSAEALARFRQEALVTSALGNPNIVEVFDFNHMEDGTPYIVMEYLRGEDLASRLQRVGRLPLAKAVEIFRQAAAALHAAHQKGIIHRDLKPQNVFLARLDDREDYVKIVDFGISKVVGSRHAMTGTHELLGSPSYMSPEQALVKASLVDLRADIFTMGTLVYLMLAGRPPFLADTMPDLLFKIVREDPPSLCAVSPDVSENVERVIFKALAKDREKRHATMEAFSQALCEAAAQADDHAALLAAAMPSEMLELDRPTAAGELDELDDSTLPDGVQAADLDLDLDLPPVDLHEEPTLMRDAGPAAPDIHQEPTLIQPVATGPHLPDEDARDAPDMDLEATAMVDTRSGQAEPPPRGRVPLWVAVVALALSLGLVTLVVLRYWL